MSGPNYAGERGAPGIPGNIGSVSNGTTTPTDDERIEALVTYEGKYQDLEKIALETMCRTAREPLFCFELALTMQRLRHRISEERRKRSQKTNV